jgi:hypothetical protein
MMKNLMIVIAAIFVLIACKNNKKEEPSGKGKAIEIQANTTNVVTLADTLLIHESDCVSCGYTTSFEIKDDQGILKMGDKKNIYNDSIPQKPGAPNHFYLVLLPQKKGTATFKLYKSEMDTAYVTSYTIEVK